MFNIKLVDIGGDKEMTEFDTVVETLVEAELLAGAECGKHLNRFDISLVHQHDLIYNVISDEQNVGMCVIRSM